MMSHPTDSYRACMDRMLTDIVHIILISGWQKQVEIMAYSKQTQKLISHKLLS